MPPGILSGMIAGGGLLATRELLHPPHRRVTGVSLACVNGNVRAPTVVSTFALLPVQIQRICQESDELKALEQVSREHSRSHLLCSYFSSSCE